METLLLLPGMSAGVAAPGVSNVTLCATLPKAKVTFSPELTVRGFGVNARPAVAATVFAGGGGGGDCDFEPYGPVPPPQAANARRNEALRIRGMCDMVIRPHPAFVWIRLAPTQRNLLRGSSFVCRYQEKKGVGFRGRKK